MLQKPVQGLCVTCAGFWCKNLCRVLVQKPVQCFGAKTRAGILCKNLLGLKTCTGFWEKKTALGFGVKNICTLLVQNHVQGFCVKSCALFWYKNLCMVLEQTPELGFGAKSFAGFWKKNLRLVTV